MYTSQVAKKVALQKERRSSAVAHSHTQKRANGKHNVNPPAQRQSAAIIQRISEEDTRQANYIIRPSVGRHGYTVEGIRNILEHRYAEVVPGFGNYLLIGLGTDEGRANLGRIVYDCYLNGDGETYTIDAYHAHGAQQEGNGRGY